MKKKLITSFLVFLLLPIWALSCYAASVPKAILNARSSVVRIYAEYNKYISTGSGFVIKSDSNGTLIATNYHVIENRPSSIHVWVNNEPINATLLCYSEQRDLCILKLNVPMKMKALRLYTKSVEQGTEVFAVGFPTAADYLSDTEAHKSDEVTITNGIVSAIRQVTLVESGKPVTLLQINADINSGNSGGPLFDGKGYVLGINTYGINDSTGINGAISAEELYEFASLNQIRLSSGNTAIIVILLSVTGILAIIGICFAFKKHRKSAINPRVDVEDLTEYVDNGKVILSPEQAVSLLLPVALELRTMHDNGKYHLEISPNSISISNNFATISNPTNIEVNRYISGFAAPEIYSGKQLASSDIYSFCALLYYVTQGIIPDNSLNRTQKLFWQNSETDGNFREIINIGLSPTPANRFDSFQTLIYKLAPYNTGAQVAVKEIESLHESDVHCTFKENVLSFSRRNRAVPLWCYPIFVIVIFFCTYFGLYSLASAKAESNDFTKANQLLFAKSITQFHDANLVKYLNAGLLFEMKEYMNAYNSFYELSGYLNSNSMANKALAMRAEQLMEQGLYADAASFYAQLKEIDYEDSSALYFNAKKKLAEKHIESNNFKLALIIYEQLEDEGYEEASEKYKETDFKYIDYLLKLNCTSDAYKKLQPYIASKSPTAIDIFRANLQKFYNYGIKLYRTKSFSTASEVFHTIDKYNKGYMRTNNYLILLRYHSYDSIGMKNLASVLLYNLIGFEDVNDLILETTDVAAAFLKDSWNTSSKSYYFKIGSDFNCSTNLPLFSGTTFSIEKGRYYLENNGKKNLCLRIDIITKDKIEIYDYKDWKTYTFIRN